MILGIDPGRQGAHFLATRAGLGLEYGPLDSSDPAAVAELLRHVKATFYAFRLVIERNHSMPKMGCASAFTFGVGWGVIQGAAAALEIPTAIVTAQKWRSWALGGMVPKDRKGREAATLAAARARWPETEWPRSVAKATAIACAAYIGAYGATTAFAQETRA